MASIEVIQNFLFKLKGFDKFLRPVKILSVGNGGLKAELKVGPEQANYLDKLHGGYSATLVDMMSGMGLTSHKNGNKAAVSLDMNVDYLGSANVGDTLEIISKPLKIGKTLAFLEVEIRNKDTGAVLVRGTHTKFLLDNFGL